MFLLFQTSVVSDFCGSSDNVADCHSLGRLGHLEDASDLGRDIKEYGPREENKEWWSGGTDSECGHEGFRVTPNKKSGATDQDHCLIS